MNDWSSWQVNRMLFGFPPAGPAAWDGILIVVDRHSHFLICIPCHEMAPASETAQLFHDRVIAPRGMPLSVTADRDTRWRAVDGIWQHAIRLAGGKMRLTPAYQRRRQIQRPGRRLVARRGDQARRIGQNKYDFTWGELDKTSPQMTHPTLRG